MSSENSFDSKRPAFPKRAVVTSGMPYGNKGLHFGHIAGVFVPADIYARFLRDRIGADNVLYVSGTDCYGSPIEEGYRKLCEQQGFEGSIEDYVGANHDGQKSVLDQYQISLDIYEGSALGEAKGFHRETTDWIMGRLYQNGFLEKIETAQFYDPVRQTYLNGRQVIGHCPVQGCKSEKGYADECDLGHQYMPEDLIDPKSTLTGETPEMRPVINWYFKLPEYLEFLRKHADFEAAQDNVRSVVATTTREFLGTPVIYIKNELEEEYRGWSDQLPQHNFVPADKGKQSFALEFSDIATRDKARDFLAAKGVRLRTGKALVPFRLTGNIAWGVPAPEFEGVKDLTIWVWPESLWAPISFSKTALAQHERAGKPKSSSDWRDWWCSEDCEIFQFIGQDNIYFYGIAQPAMWDASAQAGADDNLRQSTLIANYHVLFMNKKASSSGAVKPPMAKDLLDFYTPEQLRAHFFALGLGQKSVSFAPKAFDPDTKDNPKAADPVLKEGQLLTNVFNRLARSCFYAAQKIYGVTSDNEKTGERANGAQSYLPLGAVDPAIQARAREVALEYERLMHVTEFHNVMALMDSYLNECYKYWNSNRNAEGEELLQVTRNAFYMLRSCAVLMHPVVPGGCQMICDYLGFGKDFWSWEQIFEGNEAFCSPEELAAGKHPIQTLRPRVDFFQKHPSQY